MLRINAGIDLVMVPDNYADFCDTLIELVKKVPSASPGDVVKADLDTIQSLRARCAIRRLQANR